MTAELVQIPGYVAGTWRIDPQHSYVGFTVRHLLIAKVRGSFTEVEGTIVTAEDPLRSSVEATIRTSSIDTGVKQRDEHLRSADFFEVVTYPEITYRSTGTRPAREGFLLDGELTIKGVTRPVTLELEANGFGPDIFLPDPSAGARAGFSAKGEVSRLEFGVGDASKLAGGGLALGDAVQISLEIEAVLERPAG